MLARTFILNMLFSVMLLCLAQVIAQADALSLPQPQLRSVIHRLLHNIDAPCKKFESLTSDSTNLAEYEDTYQKVMTKRQLENSTDPNTSLRALTSSTSTTAAPVIIPAPTASVTPSTTNPTTPTTTSSSTLSTSTTSSKAVPTSSTHGPTLATTSTTVAGVPTTSATVQGVVVPVVDTTSISTSTTNNAGTVQTSQSGMPSSTTSGSSTVLLQSTGVVSSMISTSSPISPSGVIANLRTSTTLVVVQGANGPTTSTASVLVWVATSTSPAANVVQPALQSGSLRKCQSMNYVALSSFTLTALLLSLVIVL